MLLCWTFVGCRSSYPVDSANPIIPPTMLTQSDLAIPTLGEPRFDSPLLHDGVHTRFMPDDARVLYEIDYRQGDDVIELGFEKAGARERVFFDAAKSKAAVVTCGGLCPGLNNVVRNLYYQLHSSYGVPTVLGIRYGYQGLNPSEGLPPIVLTSDMVEHIHHQGGTILGTSRGPQDPRTTVDYLQAEGINMLFCIGGDGTQKGGARHCPGSPQAGPRNRSGWHSQNHR